MSLVGRKIVNIRNMTKEETHAMGWSFPPVMLILDDGTKLYPSMDTEGNGSGILFGEKGDEDFIVYINEKPPSWITEDEDTDP